MFMVQGSKFKVLGSWFNVHGSWTGCLLPSLKFLFLEAKTDAIINIEP
jgi:hypothetical protein